jgi:molybdopterin-guanine dinucleotide biosynthesis protein A
VDEDDDWVDDPTAMAKALAELGDTEATLALAEPAERVRLLHALGREVEAREDTQLLVNAEGVALDQWRALMLTADDMVRQHNFDAAEAMHWQAWQHADGRDRQGTTMHHIGMRLRNYGDRDSAAGFFEVARALRHGFADPMLLASTQLALTRVRESAEFDAIVLAGGRGSRVGGAKPELPLVGWPLLDHVLVGVSAASNRIVVGPVRRGLGEPTFVQEEPVGSGPVAAIAAAIDRVEQPLVAMLAADLPFIRSELDQLRVVVEISPDKDAAVLVDTNGRLNYLASMWRTSSLRRVIAELGDPIGLPVRALYESVATINVPDFDAHGADVDTPNDLAAAQERITNSLAPFTPRSQAPPPATPLAWPGLELAAPS